MEKLKRLQNNAWVQKHGARCLFWAMVCAVILSKLLLGYVQQVYTWVGGAPLDDELMYEAALSISSGNWLGDYNWLTLSKQMFFAVWLAFCNAIGVRYLVAGQALLCAAALAAAFAFAPVLKTYRTKFFVFAALAYSPAAAASFTLRVYRDNIFPSECLLFFAGVIGCALRFNKGLKSYVGYLLLAGLGLGTALITREDGIWLVPFALVGAVVVIVYVLREKGLPRKVWRIALLGVPCTLALVCVGSMSFMNYLYYGVFTTSDFSSGSFAAAYGAMTQIEHEDEVLLVPVPQDVREKLYDAVPELEPLRYWLEDYKPLQNAYQNSTIGDYQAGSFYWVLRRAAQESGFYETAQIADAYWQSVADGIQAAIADGTLTASVGTRTTTTPIIKLEHVVPTIIETCNSMLYCLTFRDTSCYFAEEGEYSLITAEDAATWQEYLGNWSNYATQEGTAIPYYAPINLLIYKAFNLLCPLYAVALPLLFILSLALQIRWMIALARKKFVPSRMQVLLWIILLGVFGMAWLRCAMIAFMEVAAFNIGTYVMYLSTVHPLLIIYAVVGVCCFYQKPTVAIASETENSSL